MRAGRAFWTAFTGFFTTVITVLGLEKLSAEATAEISPGKWLGALITALVVAGALYGREKIAEASERSAEKKDPP